MTIPVKPLSQIEEKSEVSASDKILILDSVSEEARLASKSELKWDKWDTWATWAKGSKWDKWDKGDTWDTWASVVGATFSWDNIVFSKDNWDYITINDAATKLKWPKGDRWPTWPQWEQGIQWVQWPTGNGIYSITSSKAWKTTTVTITETNWTVDTFQVQDWADWSGWSWSWDVTWPASATSGNIAIFDGATWKKIKDWSVSLSTLSTWAALWATAVQPWDNVSDLANDAGYTTNTWDVVWPWSSTDWHLAVFDWATGKLLKDWGALWTAATKDTWTSSWNVPILDSNWKLATSTLPWVALTDTFTVSTSSDLTSLSSAEQWDIAIATSENKTYVLSQAPYSTAANWKEILTPTGWVTSVNGQTWAVTVDEFAPTSSWSEWQILTKWASGYDWQNAPETANTKTFYLSNTSDLVNAQAALDWYLAGKNPVIVYSGATYLLSSKLSASMDFVSIKGEKDETSVNTNCYNKVVHLNLSSDTVTSIDATSYKNASINFLQTGRNYWTPYTPEYAWSPATKKYVDDKKSTISITLTSAWWSSNSQTVSATGVTASNTVIVSPNPSDFSDYTDAEIYCSAQGSGTLTFTCGTEPTNDIDVNVVILN